MDGLAADAASGDEVSDLQTHPVIGSAAKRIHCSIFLFCNNLLQLFF
jgi:hypothetical protein